MRSALLAITLTALIVLVALPVVSIILFAIFPKINELSLEGAFSALAPNLADARLIEATVNSLSLAVSVCLASTAIALPLAYWRAQLGRAGRIWDAIFLIPFLIPPYIGSYAWIQLLQRNGFMEQVVGFNLSAWLYSFPGLVAVMTLNLFPLIYFTASNGFAVIGARFGDVAAVFGASPMRIFWRIYLPLVVPALIASNLIVFVLTVEEFGTAEILGSRIGYEVIVTYIHEKLSDWPIDLPGASVLSLILIAIAFFAFNLHLLLSRRFSAALDAQATAQSARVMSGWPRVIAVAALAIVALIAVGLPLISIITSALMQRVSGGLGLDNLGLSNIRAVFSEETGAVPAILTSLTLAIAAAGITMVIGLLTAFAVVRMRSAVTGFVDFLATLPNAVPGMAIAVGLIITWNQKFWPVTPYNTWVILLLAYCCLMLPYPIRMISSALKQLPESLDEAAYIYGASEARVIVRILTPILANISIAAGFIVFAISTRELVTSIMLAPPGVETVATFVFHQFDQGSANIGMAMSLIAIVVSGGVIVFGEWLQAQWRSRA